MLKKRFKCVKYVTQRKLNWPYAFVFSEMNLVIFVQKLLTACNCRPLVVSMGFFGFDRGSFIASFEIDGGHPAVKP